MRILYLCPFYLLACVLIITARGVQGIYEDQAGADDWHLQYVGTPRVSLFHRSIRGSSVLVATDRNVIASINPRDASIEWRQVLEENERIFAFTSYDNNALSISNKDGFHIIRLWEVNSGFLIWEQKVEEKTGGSNDNASDVQPTMDVIFSSDRFGVFILLDGAIVYKFSIKDGQQLWKTIVNEHSLKTTTFKRIIHYGAALQVVGLKTTNSKTYAIEVITLDATIGDILKTVTLSSKVENQNDVIVVGGGTNSGFVVWKEEPNMRVNRLGSKDIDAAPLKELFGNVIESFAKASGPLELINLNLGSRTEFLAQVPTKVGYASAVFKVDPEGGRLAVLYDLEERPGRSIYTAVIDKIDRLIISRSTKQTSDLVKVELIAPAPRLVLGIHSIPHSYFASGDIKKAILNVVNMQKETISYRMLVISSDQSMYYWQDGKVKWKREEALAHAAEAEFVDLPERKLWSQEIDELAEDQEEAESISPIGRYIRRLTTHIHQLKDLPLYIISYIEHFVTGDYSSTEPIPADNTDNGKPRVLYRDTLGFRKLVIFVTPKKLVALNSAAKGEVVWSRYFGDSVDELKSIFVVRTAMVKYPPLIVAIGFERSPSAKTITRIYSLNALTGADFVTDDFPAQSALSINPKQIFKLPIEESQERTHILALVDEDLKTYLYPNNSASQAAFSNFIPSFYFTLTNGVKKNSLEGYGILSKNDTQYPYQADVLWVIKFADGEYITSFPQRHPHEKVASLGRVLGNRSVLYKYLNPHLLAIATFTPTSRQTVCTLNIYLIDIVKGSILHQTTHENVGSIHPVHIVQIENYVLYHFWAEGDGMPTTEKGFGVVVFDLYESKDQDDRVDSPVFSSFAHQRPYVDAQAFAFPYGVKALGVTKTKNGIATREFLFATNTDQIFGISKRFLDPRRPQHALTAEDKEEMLIPYEPAIPDNKKFILSYNLTVAGVSNLITSPALLESTSLILVYGLDLWFTRQAPSKTFDVLSEDFSKSTLIATILALVLGILITRPMVRRKNVNARWYSI